VDVKGEDKVLFELRIHLLDVAELRDWDAHINAKRARERAEDYGREME